MSRERGVWNSDNRVICIERLGDSVSSDEVTSEKTTWIPVALRNDICLDYICQVWLASKGRRSRAPNGDAHVIHSTHKCICVVLSHAVVCLIAHTQRYSLGYVITPHRKTQDTGYNYKRKWNPIPEAQWAFAVFSQNETNTHATCDAHLCHCPLPPPPIEKSLHMYPLEEKRRQVPDHAAIMRGTRTQGAQGDWPRQDEGDSPRFNYTSSNQSRTRVVLSSLSMPLTKLLRACYIFQDSWISFCSLF